MVGSDERDFDRDGGIVDICDFAWLEGVERFLDGSEALKGDLCLL